MSNNKEITEVFTKPPIFLAILEIRYKNSNLKSIEELSGCINDTKKIFPKFNKQVIGELKLNKLLEGLPSISHYSQKVDCFVYSSDDNRNQFTISLERFNYRQSGEYTNFEDFTKEIKSAWEIHNDILKNIDIIGISLRFMNRIEIKEEVKDPSEYFNISIQMEEKLVTDPVTNYSIRYITNNNAQYKHSIIALSLENIVNNIYPFILDIDVHDENPLKNDINVLWERFESLRMDKDKLFNCLITDKTKALYK